MIVGKIVPDSITTVVATTINNKHLQNLWVQLTLALLMGAFIFHLVSIESTKASAALSPSASSAKMGKQNRKQKKVEQKQEEDEEDEEEEEEEVVPVYIAASKPKASPSTAAASSVSPAARQTAADKKRFLEEERRKAREYMAMVLPPLKTSAGVASPAKSPVKQGPKPKANRAASPAPAASSHASASAQSRSTTPFFDVGATVTVAYRSEKGQAVRPGGEAKVTSASWNEDQGFIYNITYYQGGREMGVPEEFLSGESTLTGAGAGKRSRTPSKKVTGCASPKKSKN